MAKDKVFVTKSFLPDFDDFSQIMRNIFERGVLTNQGPLVQQLEQELEQFLSIDRLQFLSNGTVALQLALRALDLQQSEVITTPFSYVATVSSLLWEGCTPVFVDVEPNFFTIDPDLIEAAITSNTKAILAVHVFGKCCDVERINAIANKHNLKVIYDGAHAFATRFKGNSVLTYGDVSTLSFHATKIFHTVEGGGCICSDDAINHRINMLKRFGHVQDDHYCLGINAKQSEFHAAVGLANMKYLEQIFTARRKICKTYTELLEGSVILPREQAHCDWNYSYFPILFESAEQREIVFSALEKESVYPRRYFYPSLNTLPYITNANSCPVSEDIAQRIACLPLYPGLTRGQVEMISTIIKQSVWGGSSEYKTA